MSSKTVRCVEGQRLIYYRSQADAVFWDAHWREHLSPELYVRAAQGHLDWFEQPFLHYLPRQGRIIEAGCGVGQYVLALRMRGLSVFQKPIKPRMIKKPVIISRQV